MVSIKTIFQIHFLTHLLMSYEFEILKIYKFCNAFYFGFWTNPNIKIICSLFWFKCNIISEINQIYFLRFGFNQFGCLLNF